MHFNCRINAYFCKCQFIFNTNLFVKKMNINLKKYSNNRVPSETLILLWCISMWHDINLLSLQSVCRHKMVIDLQWMIKKIRQFYGEMAGYGELGYNCILPSLHFIQFTRILQLLLLSEFKREPMSHYVSLMCH